MSTRPRFVCNNCGGPGPLRCGRCHIVHYCLRECQRADWARHRDVCTNNEDIRGTSPAERSDDGALFLQMRPHLQAASRRAMQRREVVLSVGVERGVRGIIQIRPQEGFRRDVASVVPRARQFLEDAIRLNSCDHELYHLVVVLSAELVARDEDMMYRYTIPRVDRS
jgi:hypothetical protein